MEAFRALVERAGGRRRLLLVGEGARDGEPPRPARALLERFARDLFAEEEQPQPQPEGGRGRRRARVRGEGRGRRWRSCALLFVLVRAGSLRARRGRRRVREILRDVRGQLRPRRAPGPPPALVAVLVPEAGREGEEAEAEEARGRLEALLLRVFPERRRRRRQEEDTLQAARYLPGGPRGADEARAAACRALRAALKLQADRAEVKKMQLPAFLQCLPWGRRSPQRKGHLGEAASKNNSTEDCLQDTEEGVALTSMALNGDL